MGESNHLGRLVRSATDRFAVLRLRDLRLVFASTLVSDLGDGAVTVALAFAVLDLTHSATDLGIVMAARMIAQVLVMLIGGVVADRVSRRAVMVSADLVRFVGQVSIGVLLLAGHATVVEIAGSQVLVGAGGSFFIPASSGLIQSVAGEHVQEANALRVVASSSSGIIGPAIGGVLVVTIGARWALIGDGASYLASGLLLWRVSAAAVTGLSHDDNSSSFLADLRDGFQEVAGRTWLWAMIVVMAIGNILMASYPVLAPLICKQRYGGAGAYALLTVLWSAGMLAGGISLLRFKPRFPLRSGVFAFCPATLPGITLALHAPIYVVGACQLLSGLGMTVLNTFWWTAMQENVPAASMSRVSSWDYAATLAIMPLGFALAGPLAGAIGVSAALLATSVGALLVTLTALLVRDIRVLPSRASAEPQLAAT